MAEYVRPKVAVVGLGGQGLVTVKNLLEQGFEVIGFEKNDFVGGIWHSGADERISALPTTIVNVSRERACFTDFPFPDGTGSYPSSAEMAKYLNDYCDHFKIRPHLCLNTAVKSIRRNHLGNAWLLTIQANVSSNVETLEFDKVVVALGPHSKPIWPRFDDQEKFKGEIIHSLNFKDASRFKDKRVMVVGTSNTAGDTSASLIDVASKVYLSHRSGAIVLPRFLKNGASLDHTLTYRMWCIRETLQRNFPNASIKFMDDKVKEISAAEFGVLDPEWNLAPPSLMHRVPTVNDLLVPALRAGQIESTAGPVRILGDYDVQLTDGSVVQVDSIVCCTGYNPDFSILGQFDPNIIATGSEEQQRQYDAPKLYQNIFSLQHPESLAFVGIAILIFPAFLLSDLSSMAIAQFWSKKPDTVNLPSQTEMETWYANHLAWVSSIKALSPKGYFVKNNVESGPWLKFVEDAAGTNVARNLDYTSLQAWWNWLWNPWFVSMMVGGIYSPHFYRLFASDRRKTWNGARDAIVKVNEDVKAGLENRRRERKEVEMNASQQ